MITCDDELASQGGATSPNTNSIENSIIFFVQIVLIKKFSRYIQIKVRIQLLIFAIIVIKFIKLKYLFILCSHLETC